MRIAVIGSGAAAAGLLTGLQRWGPPGMRITVFDAGRRISEPPAAAHEDVDGPYYREVYSALHREHGFSFPPPKSHFGDTLPKFPVDDKPRLWKSANYGGLTVVWGGGMYPFSDRELADWPISAAQLAPYYQLLADRVGICGESDQLSEYFEDDFINRPPVRTSSVMARLAQTVNRAPKHSGGAWDIVAGSTRLALETRRGHERECQYTGECMLGCPNNSIWSAAQELDQFVADGFIDVAPYRVHSWEGSRLRLHEGSELRMSEPFDRIFVAAGCIGSTEIAMRSLGIPSGPVMQDNAVFSFPIFYMGKGASSDTDDYFSLCNLALGGIPADRNEGYAQFSVYPFFDHLWRYYAPRSLWRLGQEFGKQARWRVLLGRVFLAGSANRKFSFAIEDDEFIVRPGTLGESDHLIDGVMAALRASLKGSAFFVPPLRPPSHATSSHYACSFPYGKGPHAEVATSGRIAPGVYLADASTFPSLPSISPTFSIMANAARTAHASLQENS